MTLLDRIEAAMRDGMRARDDRRVSTMRMVMAAAQNRRIELGRALSDDDIVEVLGRQAKQRRESIEQFRAGGREDLASREEAELAIIGEFLPEPLAAGELVRLVTQAITETKSGSPADMGRVMAAVMPRVRGRAEGRAVSDEVRRQLTGPAAAGQGG